MHYCPNCGHQNPRHTATCLHCAATVGEPCPACGQLALPGSRFCNRCGARLPDALSRRQGRAKQERALDGLRALMPLSLTQKIDAMAPEVAGERREVTVLCLHVEGITDPTYRLDGEEVYLLTDEILRRLAEIVYEHEGTIDKHTGDGLIALLGVPVAHENDPERAVRAALTMQTALEPLRESIQKKHGLDLQARIGIHTGPVIAGKIGSDRHMEYTVLGDTVDRAVHLQNAAEPGAILVSFPTYQRTRPLFDYRPVSPFRVGGDPQPMRAFCPQRLRARPGNVRGLPGLQVPMVGRKDGLVRLQDALDSVCRHRNVSTVFVTGEAGVGKSRLIAEFVESLRLVEVEIYEANCLAHARAKPLWLLSDLVRAITHVPETDPPQAQRHALSQCLRDLGVPKEDILPHLLDVLALGQQDARMEARLRNIDGAVRQNLTHTAVRQIVLARTTVAPTILILEDLHWVDPASRDFLEHLIETVDGVPLMLILVSREVERSSVIRPLLAAAEKRPERMADIQVRPLSKTEGQQLVDQLLPQTASDAAAIKKQIVERAEGNPFFVEEIVRMMLDEEGLVQKVGTLEITPRAEELLQQVPGTLFGLIQARLDHLPEAVRGTLRTAAVLGPVFPSRLLQNLTGTGDGDMNAHLRELESRQFLVPQPTGLGQNHAFRHALIQEVVYGSLLKRDRQKLHDLVAQTLEQTNYWLSDEQTEALAYHYARGANPERAIAYLVEAGRNAARRSANETAIQHYRRALELMPEADAEAGELQLHAQMGLGQALKFLGEYGEASQMLKGALRYLAQPSMLDSSPATIEAWVQGLRELADIQVREGAPGEAIAYLQAGLDLLGDEGAQTHPHLWRLVIDRLAWVRFRQGELNEAFDLANAGALSVDPGSDEDPMTLASLYNTLGGVLWQKGNLSDAATYVRRSLELYGRVGYLWGMANAYSNLGVLNYRLGNWHHALDNWEQALAMRRTIGDIAHEAVTLSNVGLLRTALGAHEQARKDLGQALAIGQRVGEHWVTSHSLAGLAQLALIQSRFGDAQDKARTALALAETIGNSEIQVQARWILAVAQAETESVEVGLVSAMQALQMARESGLQDLEADCLRVLGILRSRTGHWLEAETHFHESIELCLQQEDPYRQGLALLELGRLYHNLAHAGDLAGSGWHNRAQEILNQAADQFKRLGAAHDLGMTQTVLGDIEEASPTERSARLPEGEWHTAAMVWLSLSPPPDADDEALFETTALVMPALGAIAEEYQGQVVRRRDGMIVAFGAPVAFEDDTERAVQTALRAVQTVANLAQQGGIALTCRVAVSRGDVVAGQVGSPFHTEFVVKGTPVNEAQRLAESAPAGSVWVTAAARTATERLFEYESAPPQVAAQLADPLISKLVGPRDRHAPTRGLPGMEARFIGREATLRAMTDLTKNLRQNLGGLIWIEGEPGIGKSRLMREFTLSLPTQETLVWRGRCSPHKTNHAFSLFADLLAHALNLKQSDSPEQIRVRIDQYIQQWPRDAQATRPHLEALLGVQPSGFSGERLSSLQPEELQRQIFVALRKLFKSLASERPLVVLMDDLHWVDPVSAELLLFLVTMVTSVPILFVCAQRRQGADEPNDRLVRTQSLISSQTIRLRLDRLSLVESEMLLDEILGQAELPTRLSSEITQRAEGNPYFIEEYVRMLIEQGHLHRQNGRWELEPDLDLADLPLPASLENLIRSRIDALPLELKRLMQYAAVVGSPFEVCLLESIPGLSQVKGDLSRLESRLLAHPAAEAGRWQFNHSLIETIAYNSLLKARRQLLHLRVAEALEARWSGTETDHAEELAHHYSLGGNGSKALQYLILAGERAAARYANEEAQSFLEQAAHVLEDTPDAPPTVRCRIAAGLGDVHREMGEYAESKAALDMGWALAEAADLAGEIRAGLVRRLGDTAQKQGDFEAASAHFAQALSLLGEPASRETLTEASHLMTSLAWTHFLQGRFDKARQACEASLEYAEQAGALNELARVENLLGGIHFNQGQWEPALQHTTRAMVLREQLGYSWGVAATLANLGILALLSGQWSKAWSFLERSLALRKEMGDVEGIVISHANLGMLARDQGKLDLAEQHLKSSLEAGIPFEMSLYVTHATMAMAQVQLWQGQTEAAQQSIATSLETARALGAKDVVAEIHQIQAEFLLATNDPDEARAMADQAASLAVEIGNRGFEAAAWRLAAEAELQRGDPQAAREALANAQRILQYVTHELQTGRVAALAGRISLAEGRFPQAEQDLREAREILARLGASRDLQLVQDTMRRLPRREAGEVLSSLAR